MDVYLSLGIKDVDGSDDKVFRNMSARKFGIQRYVSSDCESKAAVESWEAGHEVTYRC